MKSLLVGLAIIFCLLMSNIANAQSTLALQEKCAEGAKKFFFASEKVTWLASSNKELGYWYDEGGYGTTEYVPHYNKKFDKCFILVNSQYNHTWESRSKSIRAKREEQHILFSRGLFNVFEGTEVGVYDASFHQKSLNIEISRCYVGTKRCKSPEEFQELIKPYMEE